MKKYSILLFLFVFSLSFAQSVNQYKYALVPSKFSFLREPDQYQLNSLTKFLMQKQGFTVFLDTEEMPQDMMISNCTKIYVDVISSGNFMSTKLKVVLKDCKNNILFTSEEGKSKEKDYKKGYQEALRNAFNSFYALKYVYTPSETEVSSASNNVAKDVSLIAPVATTAVVATTEVKSAPVETMKIPTETLFAQPITNGYQLIDSTPKVIMKIYNTSVKDVYTAKFGDVQGVLVSKDNQWFFEYYKNDALISEKVAVKF